MSHDANCIFCKIVAGEVEKLLVYEDALTLAFMSPEQPTGHKVLVITKAHVRTVYDLDEQQAAAIMQTVVKIARAIRAASGCEGLNLVQSNESAGQQDVFHFHVHLVPRYTGDTITLDWDNSAAPLELRQRYSAEIRAHL